MYIKDYPRPQLVRPKWTNLNGEWDFAFDKYVIGKVEHWEENFPKDLKIKVPFTYETKASGIGDARQVDVVWYQRTIQISGSRLQGSRQLLHIEGCDYRADVYVNGKHAGAHTGAYSRFSIDITEYLKENENILTIRAEDRADKAQPRGKQRWTPENFGCWYEQTTGIWKTVWLEEVPEIYLTNLKMTPSCKDSSIAWELELNELPKTGEWSVRFEVSYDKEAVAELEIPVKQRRVSGVCLLGEEELHEWGIKLWSPESPNLYDVKVLLSEGNHVVDTIYSYFGLRDICCKNGQILLNGRPLFERLVLDQGYWKDSGPTPPDEEALIKDIDQTLALGYNGVRKHQKVEDERYLYWADKKGLLVWSEMGASYEFCDDAIADFTKQWMEVVRDNYNHPSIITWTPFNESWGIREIMTNQKEQALTEAIYYLTKSFDLMRPVIVNDGWEHTISDIITLHDYTADGEEFYHRYSSFFEQMMRNELYPGGARAAFADGFAYKGQPIMITEYGGIALRTEFGWGYGDQVGGEEEFLTRFDKITSAIKKLNWCSGYCYTQLTDVQQEVNGLLDIEREPKVSPDKIREINETPIGDRSFYGKL